MSEEIKPTNLIEALTKARAEFESIKKTATAKMGSYSYKYAPLDAVRNACDPALNKWGLAVIHSIETQAESLILHTELRYAGSEEKLESWWPLDVADTDPKKIAAQMTYGMRYTLCGLLGLAADEDQDALPEKKLAQGQKSEPPPQKPQEAAGGTPDDAKTKGMASVHAIGAELGYNHDTLHNLCNSMFPGLESMKSLSVEQLRQVYAKLNNEYTPIKEDLKTRLHAVIKSFKYMGLGDSRFLEHATGILEKKVEDISKLKIEELKALVLALEFEAEPKEEGNE